MSKTTHGHTANGKRSRAYHTWRSMRQRCCNPNHPQFPNYGGRGIGVCSRWNEFSMFLADIGEPPPGRSLDRIDNDGNYEPENCRWATPIEQAASRRTNFIEVNGERKRIKSIEAELGLSQGALWHRLKLGWSTDRACTTPKAAA